MYPFLSFVACASVALLYTLFFLPESLGKVARAKREHTWRNCIAPYKAAFTVLFKDNGTNRRWKIQVASLVNAVVTGTHVGLLITLQLYLLNSTICFNSVAIGIIIMEICLFRFIGSLAISKFFKYALSDTSITIVALISDICLFGIIGFLPYAAWSFFGKFQIMFEM